MTHSASRYASDLHRGQSIWFRGDSNGGHTTIVAENGFSNEGEILIESVSGSWASSFTINNGALTNRSQGRITIGQGTQGDRRLTTPLFNQGQLIVNWHSTIGRSPDGIVNEGLIEIAPGITLTVAGSFTQPGGRLQGNGTLAANVLNGGVVSPGTSAGVLTINGSYNQSSAGAMELEIGGPTAGKDYDQLRINGLADIAGRIVVRTINNFVPAEGAEFHLVTASASIARSPQLALPKLPDGLEWQVTFNNGVTVRVVRRAVAPGKGFVGQNVTLGHYSPDDATAFDGPFNLTVVNGADDRQLISASLDGSKNYGVDINEDRVIIDFISPVEFSDVPFHGLVIKNLVMSGSPTLVETAAHRHFSYDGSTLKIDWGGLSIPSGAVYTIIFAPPAPGFITGRVNDDKGAPIPDVVVGASQLIPEGLRAEIWDERDTSGPPAVVRVDPNVNFNWGTGSPHPSIGADTFVVRWTGKVIPRFSETYTFYTVNDDGVQLFVNGQHLINDPNLHPPTEFSGTITLEAGQAYDIVMEMYENGGGAFASLSWSSPSQPKEIIPPSALLPPEDGGGITSGRVIHASTVTDSNGNYSLNVHNGQWTVSAGNLPELGFVSVPSQTVTVNNDTQIVNFVTSVFTGPKFPDLVVRSIDIPAGGIAGQALDIKWTVSNLGRDSAAPPWVETILVSRNADGSAARQIGLFQATEPIAAEATVNRQRRIILPADLTGAYFVVIRADAGLQVNEDRQEGNNTTVSAATVQMLSADLVVDSVMVAPVSIFGAMADVTFTVRNAGGAPAVTAWHDRVIFSSSPNSGGLTLIDEPVGTDSPLAPGASYTRTVRVQIPFNSESQPGDFFLIVRSDARHIQPESDESNNQRSSAAITLNLPPRPDLTVADIIAPDALVPGQEFEIQWTVRNAGGAAAPGPWAETVYLSRDEVIGGDFEIATFEITDTLAAGVSIGRTRRITLPTTVPAGLLRFVIGTDSRGAVIEENEANNHLLSTKVITVPTTLSLVLPVSRIAENAANPIVRGRVIRSGDASGDLTVNFLSSDVTELKVQTTAVIPSGQTSVPFDLIVQADGIVDGPQLINVTASAAGAISDSRQIQVDDSDVPQLRLTLEKASAPEGQTVAANITRDGPLAEALKVAFLSSDLGQLLVPAEVTIPSGQASAIFSVMGADDQLIETAASYRITASSPGYVGASASLEIQDNDLPEITLIIEPAEASEGSGGSVLRASAIRSVATPHELKLMLSNSDKTELLIPASAVIPANETSVNFPIAAVNDTIVDGAQEVIVSAQAQTTFGAILLPPISSTRVSILDDDGPTLTVKLTPKLAREGAAAASQGTVSRNTPPDENLLVQLASSDLSEATVPENVLIPAGQTSANFSVNTVQDGMTDGNQRVMITAAALNFTSGADTLVVSDTDLPDLVGTELTIPANGTTGAIIPISFRVANQGAAGASGSWVQRVYLSTDALVTEDDEVVGEYPFNGELPPGQSFKQVLSIFAPKKPGDYHLLVACDFSGLITEILEDNNLSVSATRLHVEPSYTATVETEIETALAGTAIPMRGQATKAGGGPAAFELVSVHVTVRGVTRVLAALTEADGRFNLTFEPLPYEAGHYIIGAVHPSLETAPEQDRFSILGLQANPSSFSVTVNGLDTISGEFRLKNVGQTELTGLRAEVEGASQLDVRFSLPASLGPLADVPAQFIIRSLVDETALKIFRVRLVSAEGANIEVPVHVAVQARRPRLRAVPSALSGGMVRDQQNLIEVEIVNDGGAPSDPLQVLLPDVPWMRVVTPNPIAPIAPGTRGKLTLQLNPTSELPLGIYEGNIVVSTPAGDLGVPFRFRHVSDALGDLKITTVDESTYYGEGGKNLAGAKVVLRDPFGGATIGEGLTGENGELLLTGLREGTYNLEVSADKHESSTGVVEIKPGTVNERLVFLPTRLVQVRWIVEEIEIEDVTNIRIESTFETTVPVPVVTVQPALIDLANITEEQGQVDVTISNQGLIAAQNVTLNFGSHPLWEITPLVRDIGSLPAKSSLTIPVIFKKVNPQGVAVASAHSFGSGAVPAAAQPASFPCTITAGVEWKLICGPFDIAYPVPIPVINASGDCSGIRVTGGRITGGGGGIGAIFGGGGGGGGGGFGGGGGGGTGGGGRIPVSIVPVPPVLEKPNNCICDPSTFEPECSEGSIPFNLPMADVVAAAISKGLPPWAKLQGVDLSTALEGEICTCCELGVRGIKAKGSAKAEAEITILIGFDPGVEGSINVSGIGEVEYEGSLQAGVEVTLTGSITGSIETECHLKNPKFCISGSAGASAFAGVKGSLELKAQTPDGEVSGSAKIEGGISTGASFTVTYCQGEGLSSSVNFEGVTLVAKAEGEISIGGESKSVEFDFSKTLIPGSDPGVAQLATLDQFKNLDPDTLAQWFGFPNAALLNEHVARVARPVRASGQQIQSVQSSVRPTQRVTRHAEQRSVCAQVRLQIEQQAALTRKAIGATLEVDNNSDTVPLEDMTVRIEIYDDQNQLANERFVVLKPELTNIDITNTGEPVAGDPVVTRELWKLAAGKSGRARWVILPLDSAAPTEPKVYRVGGIFTYVSAGVPTSVKLEPTPVNVYPNAKLSLKYFHQRDVFSDDPFTDAIEPSEPFTLAVMVKNSGAGLAKNFRITSAQPKIVDNYKGLLIDFEIIGTEVAGKGLSPSLTATFGDIGPNSVTVGRWLLKSTLQGLFVDYKASFEHEEQFGGRVASLIDEVTIHELIHVVEAFGPLADGKPDFLSNDVEDERDLPDTLHLSDGTTAPVSVITTGAFDRSPSADNLRVQLTATVPTGWVYLRLADPADGQFNLVQVLREDGSEVLIGKNAWVTDRTFIGLGRDPIHENVLHLLDLNGNGKYTLVYAPLPVRDNTPPTSFVTALPEKVGLEIPVKWSGADEADGSGIAAYDLFVSVNGGPFVPWLRRTTLTGAIYKGTQNQSYAFFSVAIDQAGNLELAPDAPDAETVVAIVNTAPRVNLAQSEFTIAEGQSVSFTATAVDDDLPANTLTFSLTGNAPPGAAIDPASGQFSWLTGEAHGPATYQFGVRVADNGTPALSAEAQVKIVVTEVNQAPTLAVIDNRIARERERLAFLLQASDSDLPSQTLSFELAAGAPTGASLHPSTGEFVWTPAEFQGGRTYEITVIIRDNGPGALSATQKFNVTVRDTSTDFTLRMGATHLRAGESGAVPIGLDSGAALVDLHFGLQYPGASLDNLAIEPSGPNISATLLPVGADQVDVRFAALNNAVFQGGQMIGHLEFDAPSDAASVLGILRPVQVRATDTANVLLNRPAVVVGSVIVVGEQPVLVPQLTPARALFLFGLPGRSYEIESTNDLALPWSPMGRATVTDRFVEVPVAAGDGGPVFYRARQVD
ncbi:MAG: CARDB domain-containing protein [Verrucomicrobiota bacterium]